MTGGIGKSRAAYGVLVVHPLECKWWDGTPHVFRDGEGALSFEVKCHNDAVILLSTQPGLSRLDVDEHVTNGKSRATSDGSSTGETCTIVLGSHRNTKLKVERNRTEVALRDDLPQSLVSPTRFKPYWLSLSGGTLSLGTGTPGCNLFFQCAVPGLAGADLHIGFSSWDTHVGYRNVSLSKPLRALAPLADGAPVDRLATRAMAVLSAHLSADSICWLLAYLYASWRTTDPLWDACVDFLGRHLLAVARAAPSQFAALPSLAMLQALAGGRTPASESEVFDAIAMWAYGTWPHAAGDSARNDWSCAASEHSAPLCPDAGAPDDGPLPNSLSNDAAAEPANAPGRVRLRHGARKVARALTHVRFPLMTDEELARVRESPMMRDVPGLPELLHAAEAVRSKQQGSGDWQQSPRSTPALAVAAAAAPASPVRVLAATQQPESLWESSWLQRRCPADACELLYMRDGDKNGVLYHLGTSEGASSWMNPHRTGAVRVTSSSPFCSCSEPFTLSSRAFHPRVCAQPRAASGQVEAFWSVDIGPHHSLACNHYTLRMNDSTDFPRSWCLQASDDGVQWVVLRQHDGDESMTRSGQFCSWPVQQKGLQFYQKFRVMLTGQTSEGTRVFNVNFLELYGYLR